MDDQPESVAQFSRVTCVPAKILALLKTDFLFHLEFELTVSEMELRTYSDKLLGPFSTCEFSSTAMWNGLNVQPSAELHRFENLDKIPPVGANMDNLKLDNQTIRSVPRHKRQLSGSQVHCYHESKARRAQAEGGSRDAQHTVMI